MAKPLSSEGVRCRLVVFALKQENRALECSYRFVIEVFQFGQKVTAQIHQVGIEDCRTATWKAVHIWGSSNETW